MVHPDAGFKELKLNIPVEPESWVAVTDDGDELDLSEAAGSFFCQLCEDHPMIFMSIAQVAASP